MLDVISAPPGSGKTLKCVEILEQTVRKNPNRMIYTNIIGINLPGVLPIKSSSSRPFDYRDLPNGALIVYDEAHEHPAFSKVDLLKNYELPNYLQDIFDKEVQKVLQYSSLPDSLKADLLKKHKYVYSDLPQNLLVKQQEEIIRNIRTQQKVTLEFQKERILEIGRSLTMHRHFGYDIILVTQKPDLLNSFVRAAASQHIILRRLFKFPISIIYSYAEIQEQFGNATRKNALSWTIWFFPKKLFKYYISAEEHTSKSAAPLGLTLWVLGFIGLIAFAFYNTGTSDAELFAASKSSNSKQTATNTNSNTKENPFSENDKHLSSDLVDTCRLAVNIDKPECVKFFNDLSKNGASLDYKSQNSYDPAKPYDVKYTPDEFKPKDFPRFKNAIVHNGKCYPYSQQGTLMSEVSKTDCFRLASGDRPFDYFKDSSNSSNSLNSQSSDSDSSNSSNSLNSQSSDSDSSVSKPVSSPQVRPEPLQNVKQVLSTTNPQDLI